MSEGEMQILDDFSPVGKIQETENAQFKYILKI